MSLFDILPSELLRLVFLHSYISNSTSFYQSQNKIKQLKLFALVNSLWNQVARKELGKELCVSVFESNGFDDLSQLDGREKNIQQLQYYSVNLCTTHKSITELSSLMTPLISYTALNCIVLKGMNLLLSELVDVTNLESLHLRHCYLNRPLKPSSKLFFPRLRRLSLFDTLNVDFSAFDSESSPSLYAFAIFDSLDDDKIRHWPKKCQQIFSNFSKTLKCLSTDRIDFNLEYLNSLEVLSFSAVSKWMPNSGTRITPTLSTLSSKLRVLDFTYASEPELAILDQNRLLLSSLHTIVYNILALTFTAKYTPDKEARFKQKCQTFAENNDVRVQYSTDRVAEEINYEGCFTLFWDIVDGLERGEFDCRI